MHATGITMTARTAKPRVTISHLAEALGLTKGTVSRAMNGYPDISEATRQKVRRQAEKMGYRPLTHAQAIRTGRVRAMGLVLQIDEHDAHAPFLTDFLAGVTQAASSEGWTLSVSTATSDEDMADVLDRLVAEKKADGFILPRTRREDPRVRALADMGVPFTLYGRTRFGVDPETLPYSWFDVSGEDAMRRAVERLHGLGHERIAFVGGGEEYNFTHLRRLGYEQGLEACGLDFEAALTARNTRLTDEGRAATERLMQLPEPPTAIIFAVDLAALGAYEALSRIGLKIGQDVSIIGYDGISSGAFAKPALTTFQVNNRAAGAELAGLLIRQCRGENPKSLRSIAQATLLPRGSDGPPRMTPKDLAAHVAGRLD